MLMNTARRRFGDRKEGRLLRTLHPMDLLTPYLMVERNDATNYIRDRFEIGEADRYVHKKRAEGLSSFGLMHLLIAAYVRAASQRPGVNRFVSGQRIYARNRLTVNMVVKRSLRLNEESTIIKVTFDPSDTASAVYRKFNEEYEKAIAATSTDFDTLAFVINLIPRPVKRLLIRILKALDYADLLPARLVELSPFHSSLFVTSMGSLGIPPVFHHLYNFGNVGVFLSFGSKYSEYVLNGNGEAVKKSFMDYTVAADERCCDGFYFASALKLVRSYIARPEVLDSPPETVVPDIG